MVKLSGSLAALALIVAAAVGAAIPPSQVRYISWADERHRYGWVPNHKTFPCADARPGAVWGGTVCATENGGRSWRTIFRGGNYVFVAVRTSRQAGVVSTGAHGHSEWWTRDNGRHWFSTNVIGGDSALGAVAPQIAGRGSHLYWGNAYAGGTAGTIYRVTPWPPRAAAVCSGSWAWAVARPDTADPNGNHCQGEFVNAGMRSHPVSTVADHRLLMLATAPSGFVAAFGRGPSAPARANGIVVVVHHRGATVRRTLPTTRRWRAASAAWNGSASTGRTSRSAATGFAPPIRDRRGRWSGGHATAVAAGS